MTEYKSAQRILRERYPVRRVGGGGALNEERSVRPCRLKKLRKGVKGIKGVKGVKGVKESKE